MGNTTLLIVSDTKEELEDIVHHVAIEFSHYYTARDEDTAIALFEQHEPQVLILGYEKLERAEHFYLGLFRKSEKAHVTPHQTVLLCKATEAGTAYNLCTRGVFDDYVVNKPRYDVHRLRLSVKQTIERVELMAKSSETYSRIGQFGKMADDLYDSIGHSVTQGSRTREHSAQACEELASILDTQLDMLRQRLTRDDLHKGVDVLDSARLEEQFRQFKQESIKPELMRVHAKFDLALDDWVAGIESDYEKFAEPVKAFSDLISSIPLTILAVDDDEMHLNILQTILEEEGYCVTLAASGAQALAIMAKTKPDLILMDLNMPEMDGIQVTKKAKNYEALKDTPIIMLSGNREKQVVREAITAGAIDYVVKPENRAALLKKIAAHIQA